MPKDINPKIKEQLDAVLGGDALPAAMPAAAAPPPARAPQRSAGPAKPAASKPAAHKPTSKGGAAAAPPPPPPPPPVAAPDDPRPFEEELKQREKTLGPDHPDVAESCSNLAILYNQKGDAARAQPLYERALAIYEKQYGPDHPEVAHTLTDLAVLHLEAGRDGVGRPLLERALAIQVRGVREGAVWYGMREGAAAVMLCGCGAACGCSACCFRGVCSWLVAAPTVFSHALRVFQLMCCGLILVADPDDVVQSVRCLDAGVPLHMCIPVVRMSSPLRC